jgi:hypothetical protein
MPKIRRSKLVLTLLFCVAIAAFGNASANLAGIKYYLPREGMRSVNAFALQQSGEHPDVLSLGSSYSIRGINALHLSELLRDQGIERSNSYNAAQQAGRAVQNTSLLRDLLASNGCPSVVIFEVSPGSINRGGPWMERLDEYASLHDLPIVATDLLNVDVRDPYLASTLRGQLRWIDRFARQPQETRLRESLERHGGRWSTPPAHRVPAAGPANRRIERNQRIFRRRAWRDFELAGAPVNALQQAVRISRDCGAEILLLRMPTLLWGDRRDIDAYDAPFLEFMDDFVATNDVTFVNLTNDDLGLEPRHYEDPGHLNYFGAEILTTYLAQEVLPPMLSE